MRDLSGIHKSMREYAELIYQELDREIQTLKVDRNEHHSALDSLQTTVRSLQHLANSLRSARAEGKPVPADQEFRYYHFEELFRGSRQEIKDRMAPYVRHFLDSSDAPVVDLGCGRGEFLQLLKENSIPGIGVDSNAEMVKSCRDIGLDVHAGDLLDFLRAQKENSLGGIFCAQVVEHLPPDYLMKLLETAHTRLRPNAPILLETINIGSAYSFLQMYTRDLTHRTPLHPETLKFVVQSCGFQRATLLFSSSIPAISQLRLFPDESEAEKAIFNENMRKLNQLLFDAQDYAVLAYK
jgi:O-antigen chain-terminating methyltransferase